MFFVLAIMGCGDDGDACRTARVEPTRYETAAQCRAQLPDALARSRDLDFPSIAADCRRIGVQVAMRAVPPRG
jgi:hypothetical protein